MGLFKLAIVGTAVYLIAKNRRHDRHPHTDMRGSSAGSCPHCQDYNSDYKDHTQVQDMPSGMMMEKKEWNERSQI